MKAFGKTFEQRVVNFLYANPWSTPQQISGILGESQPKIRRALKDTSIFECLTIPIDRDANQRGHLRLFALTRIGQIDRVGENRSPELLAQALLMQHYRGSIARKFVGDLASMERINWVLSPWRPTRTAPFFDAMICVRVGLDRAMLVVLAIAPKHVNMDWYFDILRVWKSWRKRAYAIPATLVFWRPDIAASFIDRLASLAPANNGRAVCYIGNSLLSTEEPSWVYLIPGKRTARTTEPPWDAGASIMSQALCLKHFIYGNRKTPHAYSTTLRYWAQRTSGRLQNEVNFMLSSKLSDVYFLSWCSRYPAFDRNTFNSVVRSKKRKKLLNTKLRRFQQLGYILQINDMEGHFVICPDGLACLAHTAGVDVQSYTRYLGFPSYQAVYSTQREHTNRVLDLIRRLSQDGMLHGWMMSNAKQLFYDIQLAFGKPLKKLTITPDSSGIIKLRPAETAPSASFFWLEVDRGTRRGNRFRYQLEKYFLAFFSQQNDLPIPPIIYVVDTKASSDESRLQAVVRVLAGHSKRYANTPLRVILTTGDLLEHYSDSPISIAPIWRVFYSGRHYTDLVNIQDAFRVPLGQEIRHHNRTDAHLANRLI